MLTQSHSGGALPISYPKHGYNFILWSRDAILLHDSVPRFCLASVGIWMSEEWTFCLCKLFRSVVQTIPQLQEGQALCLAQQWPLGIGWGCWPLARPSLSWQCLRHLSAPGASGLKWQWIWKTIWSALRGYASQAQMLLSISFPFVCFISDSAHLLQHCKMRSEDRWNQYDWQFFCRSDLSPRAYLIIASALCKYLTALEWFEAIQHHMIWFDQSFGALSFTDGAGYFITNCTPPSRFYSDAFENHRVSFNQCIHGPTRESTLSEANIHILSKVDRVDAPPTGYKCGWFLNRSREYIPPLVWWLYIIFVLHENSHKLGW